MYKIISLLFTLGLVLNLYASAKVETSLIKGIKSSISDYNKLMQRADVKLEFEKAIYNKSKSKVKVVSTWHTKGGEQVENVILKRDEFAEYLGSIKSSKNSKKSGFMIQIKSDDAIMVDQEAKRLLKKYVKKYDNMFKKAKVRLDYSYALYNKEKNKIKLVAIWKTKAGENIENIILEGDEFGEFAGNFAASKKNREKGKKGLPISITLDI